MTTRSTTCIRSLPQSGSRVEQENGNPELNPCICISSSDPVVGQGVRGIVDCLSDANTAYISRLSREGEGEYTPASTENTDRGRSVGPISRDVTASGGTQDVASGQAEQADRRGENVEIIRYLKDFNSSYTSEAFEESCMDTAHRTDKFSKVLISEETDVKVNVLNPVLHTFTSEEGAIVNVYDSCRKGICTCYYQLSGEMLQLKPCRFAYLVSLGTAECKKAYEPLVSNVVDGFRIVDDNMDLSDMHYECENYSSVYTPENKKKLDSIIGKELSEGYLKIVNKKPTCVHSMGAVPKPDGGIRPITDCSMPRDISVNNFCADIIQDFQYKNVDHVLAMLQEGDYMAVVDIKSAYRAVPIFPDHRKYLGLKWEINGETVFIEDTRLCFGLCLGPSYFDKISGFVYNILADMYNIQAVNYLDDFIVIGATLEEATWAQKVVIKILRYLGFYISWGKVTPPSQVCRYLGLDIDSIKMEIRLPKDKLEKLINLLKKYVGKSTISKKELESLGGLLAHCSHVVDGGRTHSRRFYDLYKVILKNDLKRVKLGKAAREDLDWWLKFCATFNGKRKIEYEEYPIPLISDSSLKGFAVYKGKEWLGGTWEGEIALENSSCGHITSPPGMDTYDRSNINELELWPILEGLRCWYPEFKGKSVTIFTDNTQVMYMLRKGTSTNSTCMEWLREIFWITKNFNIRIVAKYVNTKSNLVADTLSRLLYIKNEGEARKCLEGSGLCCIEQMFSFCRKRANEKGPKFEEGLRE